ERFVNQARTPRSTAAMIGHTHSCRLSSVRAALTELDSPDTPESCLSNCFAVFMIVFLWMSVGARAGDDKVLHLPGGPWPRRRHRRQAIHRYDAPTVFSRRQRTNISTK